MIFACLFPDEPYFGNTSPHQRVDSGISCNTLWLSWCSAMNDLSEERFGNKWFPLLFFLWNPQSDEQISSRIRFAYMGAPTLLVEKNFSRQIGDRCADHSVEYIGHMIEDANHSASMGSSLGYYFHGLSGQHTGGIAAGRNKLRIGVAPI